MPSSGQGISVARPGTCPEPDADESYAAAQAAGLAALLALCPDAGASGPPSEPKIGGRHRQATRAGPRRAARVQRRHPADRTASPAVPTDPWRIAMTAAMSRRQRACYVMLAGTWLLLSGYFWAWWVLPGHAGNPILFIVVSVALFYNVTVLPSFYLFYLGHMRRPVPVAVRHAEAAKIVGRVAVISLTVPGSESLDIVRRQLVAMTSIRYPHDSWILVDKEHSPAIARLAAQMGVLYFCRHDTSAWGPDGIARWNASGPPFQAKTKAGNVNSWLDRHGYHYTHFTQFDIDHHPVPTYLERVLGFFLDPKVAWVQAPSVYGNHEHWTARGSSEQEVVLQGPLQMGFFGFCRTPFIIGSHCTYDLKAIQDIGGFQPTRAEDHLDTVFLAASGREGVYLPEVIAVGDGPETFGTYLAQQFAWAFSMIQVLFRFTPRCIRRYTPRQALQFLFVQTWYTFWSLSMLIIFSSPLLSLAFNAPISHVTLWGFLGHNLPATLTATAVWWWSRTWHQPAGVKLSWRGIVLHVARWVIVLSAFAQVVIRVKKPYMITVKGMGADSRRPFPLAPLAPYAGLFAVALSACWFYIARYYGGACQGYLFFGLEDAALFWLLVVIIVIQDTRALARTDASVMRAVRLRLTPLLLTASMTAMLTATAIVSYGRVVQALLGGVS
jgi:cellulose synthase (UDP-forming)